MKSSSRNLIIGGVVLVGALSFVYSTIPMHRAGHQNAPYFGSTTSIGLVDQSLRELNWGNIAFNAPATMRYAQPQLVELLLSPALSVADLQARLQQGVSAVSAHVRISNRMEAQVAGRGFTIQALTPDLQAVTSQAITRWKWEVTPTEQGPQTLHFALSAYIDVAGRDVPLVVRTFDREIQVEITLPQLVSGFVHKNWQWLWAAIVVPIAGYYWKHRKKRRAQPTGSAPKETAEAEGHRLG